MKVLVWSISIPWVLMLNISAQPAESLPAERMMRSLKLTISVIDTRQSVEEVAAEQQVAGNLWIPLLFSPKQASCPLFSAPTPLFQPSLLAHEIEPRAGPMSC
jgi:hypothetical protein